MKRGSDTEKPTIRRFCTDSLGRVGKGPDEEGDAKGEQE